MITLIRLHNRFKGICTILQSNGNSHILIRHYPAFLAGILLCTLTCILGILCAVIKNLAAGIGDLQLASP